MRTDPTFEDYQYVRRSVRRQRLTQLLAHPMTAVQLAAASAMRPKTVCKVLSELRERGLVRCLAPDKNRCRPYALTMRGTSVRDLIDNSTSPSPSLSEQDQQHYGEVCHRHRAAVVRGLGQPRRAAEIKRWLRSHLPGVRISANNIRDVLHELSRLGVVHRADNQSNRYPLFALTARGQRFRDLLDQVVSNHPSPTHRQELYVTRVGDAA